MLLGNVTATEFLWSSNLWENTPLDFSFKLTTSARFFRIILQFTVLKIQRSLIVYQNGTYRIEMKREINALGHNCVSQTLCRLPSLCLPAFSPFLSLTYGVTSLPVYSCVFPLVILYIGFPQTKTLCEFIFPMCIACSTHRFLLDHTNNVYWTMRIIKLLIA
jgi:hypothetical protein